MENSSQNAKGKLHFGYLVVAAMVLTSFIPLSLGLSCAGIFYPALSDYLGVERGMLSYYTSVLWIAALVTLPFLGKLLNGRDARLCLTGAVVIIVAAFVWLSFTQALWMFYVAAVAFYAAALCFGAYYGITNVMMPIFTRKSFGDRDYAQIYSRVSMVASISNAAAAFIWGTVIDATHSYMPMFIGVIVLMAATIVTVMAIGRMQSKAA